MYYIFNDCVSVYNGQEKTRTSNQFTEHPGTSCSTRPQVSTPRSPPLRQWPLETPYPPPPAATPATRLPQGSRRVLTAGITFDGKLNSPLIHNGMPGGPGPVRAGGSIVFRGCVGGMAP